MGDSSFVLIYGTNSRGFSAPDEAEGVEISLLLAFMAPIQELCIGTGDQEWRTTVCMSLDCERKLEYPRRHKENRQTQQGKTPAETRIQTGNLEGIVHTLLPMPHLFNK
ncbi:unnamed protein product [Pleuronectes platessa]|uniref:Uncharacterized protein n=1 Tax=Pleuronectes platessa TaxID=8262 RepID=A0A9N7TUT1_PLEPL|nr:unnamed protein product [Pleuronectes platessa]